MRVFAKSSESRIRRRRGGRGRGKAAFGNLAIRCWLCELTSTAPPNSLSVRARRSDRALWEAAAACASHYCWPAASDGSTGRSAGRSGGRFASSPCSLKKFGERAREKKRCSRFKSKRNAKEPSKQRAHTSTAHTLAFCLHLVCEVCPVGVGIQRESLLSSQLWAALFACCSLLAAR